MKKPPLVPPDQCSLEIASVLQKNLPHLRAAEARGLSEWLLGVITIQRCCLTGISVVLAFILGQPTNTVRQRLRELYLPAPRKRGAQRRVFRASLHFTDLLAWILRLWQGKHLCIALDAVYCGDTIVVLCFSILYRGCAIPVAWKALPANRKGAWLPAIMILLRRFRSKIPPSMKVLFLSDRGLWSPELFLAVRAMKWHPMMRVQAAAYIRVTHSTSKHVSVSGEWQRLKTIIQQGNQPIIVRGLLFKIHKLPLTLLACWEEGHKEAWFIASDLPPAQCNAAWYGLRMWIEQGFKSTKSAGCDWEHSRITDPVRAERIWMVYAIAALWFHAVASTIEVKEQQHRSAFPEPMSVALNELHKISTKKQPRRLRLYRMGQLVMLVLIMLWQPLVIPSILVPEPLAKPRKTSVP